MRKYESLYPGFTELLLEITNKELKHARDIDREKISQGSKKLELQQYELQQKINLQRRGQAYGLSIAVVALSLASLTAFLGSPIAASAISVSSMLGFLFVYLHAKKS